MGKTILLFLSLTISMMSQAAVYKTVNVTAGGLSSALTTTQFSTVTNLTITGTIDARDFVTMRDYMPVLAVLDISAVTIAAYNGSGGTYTDTSYPANAIPEYSFYNSTTNKGKTTLTTIILPSSVFYIENYAFAYCSGLTSITIPSSVFNIENYAFAYCSGLTSITILPSDIITSIGLEAFYGCSGLTSITIPSSVTSIGDGAFEHCSGLTSITIPSSVNSIRAYVFAFCGLTSITIPSSVGSIEDGAFFDCYGLTSITIPSSVTSIGDDAFDGCSGLTSITIPSSSTITSIGLEAFYGCSGLTSITIPSSVTSIGDDAFDGCSGLTSIYAYPTTPVNFNSGESVFYGVNTSTCILYVPKGYVSAYANAYRWSAFTHIKEMTTTSISTATVNSVYLYPNPVTDGFFIKGLNGNGILTILDISGKPLLTKQISGNEYVSISNYPKGLYIVKIITAEGVIERKVLKE